MSPLEKYSFGIGSRPHLRKTPTDDPDQSRRRESRVQFQLPWEVWINNQRIARFRQERDARGFAKARYGANAEILNLQHD